MIQEQQASPVGPLAVLRWLRSPKPSWFTVPLTAFVITRLFVLMGAYLPSLVGISLIPSSVQVIERSETPVIAEWARWDTNWYLRIAEQGYRFVPGTTSEEEASVVFFPLYPLMMATLAPLVGSALTAGLLISNVCLLLALILLYRLTEQVFSRPDAARAVFYIAIFPAAFFFSAAYTESLFLLVSLGAVYFARKQRWGLAAFCGVLASATRIPGILLLGVIGYEWMQYHGWTVSTIGRRKAWSSLLQGIRQDWRNLLLICLVPSGLLAYMLYLKLTFGDPLAFNYALQVVWHRQTIGPLAALVNDINGLLSGQVKMHTLPFIDLFNIVLFFPVLLMCIPVARRLGAAFAIYCALSILVPASSRTESLNRYVVVLFPIFMVLAVWGRRRWVDRLIRVVSLPLLVLFTTFFINWIFVG